MTAAVIELPKALDRPGGVASKARTRVYFAPANVNISRLIAEVPEMHFLSSFENTRHDADAVVGYLISQSVAPLSEHDLLTRRTYLRLNAWIPVHLSKG